MMRSLLVSLLLGLTSCHTDLDARARAWAQHQAMARTSPYRHLEWQSIGPTHQGGRIECVACPPGDEKTIYVGAGSGNLWKTVDEGKTWQPIFDHESTFAIGDIAIAPSNPDTLYVGTGERLMARSSYAGTGVFKSTDAGETWRSVGLRETHHIGRVLVHPQDPDTVFVAAIGHMYTYNEERGVYRTKDGGETWKRVLYLDEKTGVIDLVLDPENPDTIYATSWERDRKAWGHIAYGANSGIHKSTDGGTTWRRLRGFPSGPHIGRIGIDVARQDPNVLYAIVDARGDDEGVYRSNDAGQNWHKVNQTKVPAGYDFCQIRISPVSVDELYVPGQYTWHSIDGGKRWRRVRGRLDHDEAHGSKTLHLDAHAFVIDPNDPEHILLGNDGGLHITRNGGVSWRHVNNLPIGEFYDVHYDMARPFRVYGGTQDNAALYGPHDGSGPWKHVFLDPWGGGDSYFTYVDPSDSNTIYYEHQFGDLRRKNMIDGETKGIRPRSRHGEEALRFNWMTPYWPSRYDDKTLYLGTQFVHKSTDRGDSWQRISPDLTSRPSRDRTGNVPFGTLTSISESPLRRGLLYVGADDGRVHVTHDDGGTWTRIDMTLPDKWVSRVLASTHAVGTVYVTLTGYREDDFASYIYRSTDFGKTWQSITNNLPAESVNVIGEDPKHPNRLFVGTDLGCYMSADNGVRWHSLCATLPTTPVHSLFVHPRDDVLVIGTHGRSVFVLRL